MSIIYMMETAGVEPASKDIGTKASTRVVDILSFATSSAYQRAYRRASLIGFNVHPQAANVRIACSV